MTVTMVRMPCLMGIRDFRQKWTRILAERVEVESVNGLEEEVHKDYRRKGDQSEG